MQLSIVMQLVLTDLRTWIRFML